MVGAVPAFSFGRITGRGRYSPRDQRRTHVGDVRRVCPSGCWLCDLLGGTSDWLAHSVGLYIWLVRLSGGIIQIVGVCRLLVGSYIAQLVGLYSLWALRGTVVGAASTFQ